MIRRELIGLHELLKRIIRAFADNPQRPIAGQIVHVAI
jgi:hypothetical protein